MARLKRKPRGGALGPYYDDCRRVPLLTAAEEVELGRRVRAGDRDAADRMASANLRLVVRIAEGYVRRGIDFEDLVGYGNLGLLRAIEGFDSERGIRFSTYASYWVKQAIRRAILDHARPIRVPVHQYSEVVRWRATAAKLRTNLGREPTHDETAAAAGLSRAKAATVAEGAASLRLSRSGGADLSLIAFDPPSAAVEEADESAALAVSLAKLDPREAVVIRHRFGLGGTAPETLRSIGERIGVNRERVRQIEDIALEKLGRPPRRPPTTPDVCGCPGCPDPDLKNDARPLGRRLSSLRSAYGIDLMACPKCFGLVSWWRVRGLPANPKPSRRPLYELALASPVFSRKERSA